MQYRRLIGKREMTLIVKSWRATYSIEEVDAEAFTDKILASLTDMYVLESGEVVQGNTEKYIKEYLPRGFPSGQGFEDIVKALGFRYLPAKNKRNQSCTVITV